MPDIIKAKEDAALSMLRCNGRLWRQSASTYLITQNGNGVATCSASVVGNLISQGLLKIVDGEIRAA